MNKYILITLPIILLLAAALLYWRYKQPEELFEPGLARNELLETVARSFTHPGNVLILGPGGIYPEKLNEVEFFLKKGWKVWAIDDFSNVQRDYQLFSKEFPQSFKFILADFADVDWQSLPDFDLVWSSYALPFIEPAKIQKFWPKMVNKIKQGGRFAGIAKYRGWYGDQQKEDQLFTREQIDQLFDSFNVEYYHNWEESGHGIKPVNIEVKVAAFKVIAQKI